MKKIDYKEELKQFYTAPKTRVKIVDVPEQDFLIVDGVGDPLTVPEFQEGVEALFEVANQVRELVKNKPRGVDYHVMPLECLWWVEGATDFEVNIDNKDDWRWSLMVAQPEHVSLYLVFEAMEKVRKAKNPKALDEVRYESMTEGKSAQILHEGPFGDEGPAVEKLLRSILRNGCKPTGKHHEIYLSDLHRDDPEVWQTIIRQPIVEQ